MLPPSNPNYQQSAGDLGMPSIPGSGRGGGGHADGGCLLWGARLTNTGVNPVVIRLASKDPPNSARRSGPADCERLGQSASVARSKLDLLDGDS